MSQRDYRCKCKPCGHEFIAHECSPTNKPKCTNCGIETQDCERI